MDNRKEKFEEFCKEAFINGKGSKTITKCKGEKIVRLLKKKGDLSAFDPKFRHWVKNKEFQLISHSALGLKDVLCLPAKCKVSSMVCCSLYIVVDSCSSTTRLYKYFFYSVLCAPFKM